MRHAVALVDLDRDVALHAEIDEPLLPLLGINPLGIAKRLKCRERRVAQDVDAVAVNPFGNYLERALENPPLERGIAEAVALLEHLDPAFHEGPGVVVANPFSVEVDLVDRADEVVQRLAGVGTERRRDTEVVFETDPEAETRSVIDVALHVVLVAQLLLPGVVIRHSVRPGGHALRAVRKRHGAVRAVAVDMVIEERVQISVCPAQAASTIVQKAPDTSVWPPSRRGNGASRAASVKSRSGFVAIRSVMKRYDAKRSSAAGRHRRCAKRTSMSKSIPSPSSPIFAKKSRALRASPETSRPAACMPRSSASIRTRHAVCDSMNVHTGAPTRPATTSSLSGVVTIRMSASMRSPSRSCHAGRARSSGGHPGWRVRSAASVGVSTSSNVAADFSSCREERPAC